LTCGIVGPISHEIDSSDILSLPLDEGIMIESWQMPMLNRTKLEAYEKVKPEYGDGYIALFEVHHQLHCLVSGSSHLHHIHPLHEFGNPHHAASITIGKTDQLCRTLFASTHGCLWGNIPKTAFRPT